jgi:hypothetical protein
VQGGPNEHRKKRCKLRFVSFIDFVFHDGSGACGDLLAFAFCEKPDVQVRPLYVPGVDAKPEWQFSARVLSVEI